MKFKKEDFGLYFALTMVGAGVGLLVGSLVGSRLKERRQREDDTAYLTMTGMAYDTDHAEEVFRGLENGTFKLEPGVGEISVVPVKSWEAPEPSKPQRPNDRRSRNPRSQAKAQKALREDKEYQDLLERYQPSQMQTQLYLNGLVTLDELRTLIIDEALAASKAPYDYAEHYRDVEEEKPELAELVSLSPDEYSDELIDDRFKIMDKPPLDKRPKSEKTLIWDYEPGEEDTFTTITRDGRLVPVSLSGLISDEAWEAVQPYLLAGLSPVYVDDLEKDRFFKFVMEKDLENLSTEDDGDA